MFGVSDTSVRKHARIEGWKGKRDELLAKAASNVDGRVVRSLEERRAKALGIIDTSLDQVDADLENGEQRAKWERLPEFVKLAELLSGQATDRVSYDELQDGFRINCALTIAELERMAKHVPKAKRSAVLREAREHYVAELNEALGAVE